MTSYQTEEIISPLHHDEFLPPISQWMTLGGVFIAGTVVIGVGIAGVTPFPVTAEGKGTVRPQGESKLVNTPVEGKVKEILVASNESIERGETMILLDDSTLQIEKQSLEHRINLNYQKAEQIEDELNGIEEQIAAQRNQLRSAVARSRAELDKIRRDYQQQRKTTTAQVREATANLSVSREELQIAKVELEASKAAVDSSESTLKVAQERLNRYERVAEEGALSTDRLQEARLEIVQAEQTLKERQAKLESRKRYIVRQKRSVEAAEARLEEAQATANPTDATVKAAEEEVALEKARGTGTLSRLVREKSNLKVRQIELNQQIESDQNELQQIELKLENLKIKAPTSGKIVELTPRNVFQSVSPGEKIATIVPTDTSLQVKVQLPTEERGKVELGQKAQMRVGAYPYPDYGLLNGKVIEISADTINYSQGNSEDKAIKFYEVTIEPDQNYLRNDPQYAIEPGMNVTADIVTEEETVLQFVIRRARLFVNL